MKVPLNRSLMTLLGTGLLLMACGQQQAPEAEANTAAAGAAIPAAYRDQSGAAWSYTAPKLGVQASASTDASGWTSVLSAQNAWGPVEINMSNGEKAAGDGRPLTMGGKVYGSGLGLHAGASLTMNTGSANGTTCQFSADVGVDDEVGNQGSVVFQAYVNGSKVYDSGVLRGSDPAAKSVAFSFPSGQPLKLVFTDAGDNTYFDHADLATPKLSCAPGGTLPLMSVQQPAMQVYHLHSGSVQVTFSGVLSGRVQLRLEADPITASPVSADGHRETPPLVLDTREVSLSGGASQTQSIKISAPTAVDRFSTDDKGTFRLIASAGGKDLGSVPLTLTELPLKLSSRLEPGSLSGRAGDSVGVTLVTTVDPPLAAAVQLSPFLALPDGATLTATGPTTGSGSEMHTPLTFRIGPVQGPAGVAQTFTQPVYVNVPGVTTGRLDHFYGNDGSVPLNVNAQP